jgi:hypothetical protein
MAQKTKRIQKNPKNNKSRRRNKEEQLRTIKKDEGHVHRYYSKMIFDGKNMITETQKDNQPIKRRKCTLEELKQEIPIGAELIIDHLDRKVPRAIQYPLPKGIEFKSVLPNPADLGLMPPNISMNHTKKHRKIHNHSDRLNGENLRLMVEEDDEHDDHTNRKRRKRPRDLFGLP